MDHQIITREVISQALDWQEFPPREFHNQSGILNSPSVVSLQQVTIRFNTSQLFTKFAMESTDVAVATFDNSDLIDFLESAFCGDIKVMDIRESIFNGWIDFTVMMTVDQERLS